MEIIYIKDFEQDCLLQCQAQLKQNAVFHFYFPNPNSKNQMSGAWLGKARVKARAKWLDQLEKVC